MWLRQRLADPTLLVLPGAYDALSARVLADVGAEAIYLGSYALTASSLAGPDIGLLSFGELLSVVRGIREAIHLPLVVDIDTGYGSPTNVRRTVSALTRAGVSAVQIEDQTNPKRCGHFAGKEVVPRSEAVARVAAAVEGATSQDAGVIARTDALATHGIDEVIARCLSFEKEGSAATFVDAVQNVDQIRQIRSEIDGPIVFNAADTGISPRLSRAQLKESGVGAVLFPIDLLLSAWRAVRTEAAAVLSLTDDEVRRGDQGRDFAALNSDLRLDSIQRWEQDLVDARATSS